MRASRLVELLVRLQLRGSASASELASALEVSVRTIYRDIEALSAAGVPVYTEVGRNGGVRIDPAYRIARLPRLDVTEARSVLFAIVPALAEQLGLDAESTERTLLPALERSAENAARVVQQRLLVEPSHWFLPTEEAPVLADVATAVWESREIVIAYRGERIRAQPLGLILKGDRWYLLGRAPGRHGPERVFRLFRLSRAENVEVLDHRFDRPAAFDLAAQWRATRQEFLDALPAYHVTIRVSPQAEPLLGLLEEGRPRQLPLPADTERDEHGWAILRLKFERRERTVRQLLRLGADAEVLDPPDLRESITEAVRRLAQVYVD